jgi:glycosyltransferase involved in cell wall biosynthesis
MKIALLTEKYTPDIGGLAISSERLARLLTSAGHKVRLFCPSPNLPPSEKRTLPSNGVNVTRFGAHKRVDDTLVDWFDLMAEEHSRDPFDVLHAYFLTQAGFIATYAGKYLSIPSVVSIRGNDIDRAAFDPSKFSHFMYALQSASAVTTNANILVNKAQALVEREITLIPNGIDSEHFKPMEKNRGLVDSLGIPLSGAPVIGFVGELREKKGLRTLLNAYAQVSKKQQTILLIVGTIRQGEDREFFNDFISQNSNLQIYVTNYIAPGDLPAYYSLIDVFVHPSIRDGMPNAILEAMACEKAVIATPVGGVLDFLQDGTNGVFVPVNDANALTGKILELLENSTRRAQLGKQARATIVGRFSPKKELEANLHVYRKLGLST